MIDRMMKPINDIYNRWVLHKNHVQCGRNLKVNGRVYVYGDILIGDSVSINSGFKYNPIGGQERTILYSRNGGKIKIGNNVGISNSSLFSVASITIKDNVKVGGSCKIYDTDFHSLDYYKRISDHDTDIISKPILIKEGAFVGAHSLILKGVIIGKHSIVGAGSIVTKNIPDNEIWAGNPACFIRKVTE